MLRRLYVHNYKCLVNFEWRLDGLHTSLLIGKNGSGKSSVADVLMFFRDIGRGENDLAVLGKEEGFWLSPLALWNGRRDSREPMIFELDVELDGVSFSYRLVLGFLETVQKLGVTEERLMKNGTTVYTRDVATVHIAREKQADVLLGHDEHSVFLPTFQNTAATDSVGLFKAWLANMVILAPVPFLMTGQPTDRHAPLKRTASNLADWVIRLQSDSEAASQIGNHIREVFPDFKAFAIRKLDKDASYGPEYLFLRFHNEQTSEVPFFLLSDGEKGFFLAALLRASAALGKTSFCFWDEPDCHLATHEIGFLVRALRSLNGQSILASHQLETIRQFSDESTFVLLRPTHLAPTRPPRTLAQLRDEKELKGDLGYAILTGDLYGE